MPRSFQGIRKLSGCGAATPTVLLALALLLGTGIGRSEEPEASGRPRTEGEWTLYTLNGRDYVPVENAIRFYELQGGAILAGKARTSSPESQGLHLISEDQREVYLNGVRHWLCFPAVEKDEKILISRVDLVKTIEPVLRPHMIRGLKDFDTVVLDAGHGGQDRGAVSRFGHEKNFALDVARRVRILLKATGLNVVMTRDSDTFIPLEDRPAVANKIENSIFVSIHFNAGEKGYTPGATGIEVFALTPRSAPSTIDQTLRPHHMLPEAGNVHDAANLVLATSVHHAILGRTQLFDRGVKRARFAVLRHSKRPAVLVEGGFLSNPDEARLIATPTFRTALARSIASGIVAFKRFASSGIAPKTMEDYRPFATRNVPPPKPSLETSPPTE